MLGLIDVSVRRALCALSIPVFVLALAACNDDIAIDPPAGDKSVCCLTEDGLTDLMTDDDCKDASGTQVALEQCDAELVSLCCMTKDGATSYMTNVE